jgi:hypothetical protein
MNKTLIVSFKGNKAELHKQLKDWCKKSDRTMNGRILELIAESLKNQ